MKPNVTVVVPTYNRAHLLEHTIPTYLQDEVDRLILVDDNSSDHTQEVAKRLADNWCDRIVLLRNPRNLKQTISKNRGKACARTPYVYFGDDDSILLPGSMARLLETSTAMGADIVGAVALYCKQGQREEDALRAYQEQVQTARAEDFVNLRKLTFRFSLRPGSPIALPVTHSGFLVKQPWYDRFDFDQRFTGNCYREETDFLLSCKREGAKIFLDGRAVQINLPPQVSTGGARSMGRLQYEYFSIVNTVRFLRKHRSFYKTELQTAPWKALSSFVWARAVAATNKLFA